MAEIIGVEKIVRYLDGYDFQKIKLSKGTDAMYIRRMKPGETQEDLVRDFREWIEEFIDSNNFQTYKLEIFGSDNEEPGAKLRMIVKTSIAFHNRHEIIGASTTRIPQPSQTSHPIDVDKYIAVATENATLKAQLERMEEKMDEILADEDEDDGDVAGVEPQTFGQAVNQALIGKIDTIVDVVLGYLAKNHLPQQQAVNGVDDDGFDQMMEEFRQVHPDINQDIYRFLQLAKTQPQFFSMVINQLRSMIK